MSFHQDSQRVAVGHKRQIVLYDVRSATKSGVLNGHEGEVTCVAYSASGKQLASYSVEDSTVRVWNTSTGLLSLLGSSKMVTSVSVPPMTRRVGVSVLLDTVSVKWPNTKNQRSLLLSRDRDRNIVVDISKK